MIVNKNMERFLQGRKDDPRIIAIIFYTVPQKLMLIPEITRDRPEITRDRPEITRDRPETFQVKAIKCLSY